MAITEAKLRPLTAADEGPYFDRKSLLRGPARQKRPRDRREVRNQIAEYVARRQRTRPLTLMNGGPWRSRAT